MVQNFMCNLVTIGIPIYKRLEYLPHVLKIVCAQDYPHIELLVSDNGVNGQKVRDIVEANYSGLTRFRQNPSTVGMSIHFNQIIHAASGEYFLLLADDDEISSNYVSELVGLLDRNPQSAVAIGMQETIDESGVLLRRSSDKLPEMLAGPDFVRAAWGTHEYGYESFSTFLARRKALVECGGFPDFWKGSANDDALILKLCLDNFIMLSSKCAFRKRNYDTSYGFAMSTQDLARGIKDFLQFLDSSPIIAAFARKHPSQWSESKRVLVDMAWRTYYYRWTEMYRERLSPMQWMKAGFALPFFPQYYKAVTQTLAAALLSTIRGRKQVIS